MSEFSFRRNWGPAPNYPRVEKYKSAAKEFMSVAGPCAVESAEQIHEIASVLGKLGIRYLRGGIFRAGTYPGTQFGWIKESLVAEFYRAAHDNGMQTIIEILDYQPDNLRAIDKYADCYQVGARQMQNYNLLKILSIKKRKVFLKRNMGSTLDEFLGAAEWLLKDGYCEPILVERGSSTYHNHVRWEPSISMIPAVKAITKMPIIIDASHSTGRRDLVEPITLAGIAAGADGFLIEVHPRPDGSLSDSSQAYPLDQFEKLRMKITRIKTNIDFDETEKSKLCAWIF